MICHPLTEAQLVSVVLFPVNTKYLLQSIECEDYKRGGKKKK